MLKKRIIFTLLYKKKNFYLSRNFNHQKIGNIDWLFKNYKFKNLYQDIDELVILNIENDKNEKLFDNFCNTVKKISKDLYFPLSAGGQVNSFNRATKIFNSGCEKVVINSSFFNNQNLVDKISKLYGSQSIIFSVDYVKKKNNYYVYIDNGKLNTKITLKKYLSNNYKKNFGEIMLRSIDRDGSGQGYDLKILKFLPSKINKPIIISGGAGHENHLLQALLSNKINAVNTSNLLNFINDGLKNARLNISKKIKLPNWK